MKCISLWQPWATLVAVGAKQYETRGWPTHYRGPLAIHAAKKKDAQSLALCLHDPFRSAITDGGYEFLRELPFGAIVAVCTLADCTHTVNVRDKVSDAERAFGDYRDGRFAWRLDDVRKIEPIPYLGMQGLFDVPDDVLLRLCE